MAIIRTLGSFIVVMVVFLGLCLGLLVTSHALPISRANANMGLSAQTLSQEGLYPMSGFPFRPIALDNFTESLMVNIAYSAHNADSLKASLINLRYEKPGGELNQIQNLEALTSGSAVPNTGYERYWHGYLVYLRPLLAVVPYSMVRIVLTSILSIGLIWFLILAYRKLGIAFTISMTIGLLAADVIFLGQSMQFAHVFIIGLYASIFILYKKSGDQSLFLLYFLVGALTSFIDLLTAPLVTLGLILVTATYMKSWNVRSILLHCVSWGVGYVLMWASKWIIVGVLYNPQAIQTALEQILNRTVNKADADFSHVRTLQLNMMQLIGYHKTNKILDLFAGLSVIGIWLRYFKWRSNTFASIAPWVLVGIIPYCWYLIAANHSYLHVWYTYRAQFMSLVSGFIILSLTMDRARFKHDFVQLLRGRMFSRKTNSNHEKRTNKVS